MFQPFARNNDLRRDLCATSCLVTAVVVAVFCWGRPALAEDKPPANDPPAFCLEKLVQHSGETKKVEFPWGWIKWVMNAEVDPQAEMTFGIVHVNAGQENPVHIHGNCEEVLYMVSGSCEHKVGDQTVVLKAGDVIRIPRGVHHSARTFDKQPMRAIIVYNAGQREFEVVGDPPAAAQE